MLACDYVLFIVYESATRKKACPVPGDAFLRVAHNLQDRDYLKYQASGPRSTCLHETISPLLFTQSARSRLFPKSIGHNTQIISINFVKYDFRKNFI